MLKIKSTVRSKRSASESNAVIVSSGSAKRSPWHSSSLLLLILFVAVFGSLGSYLLFSSHADTTKVACSPIGSARYNCKFYEITPVKNGSDVKVGTIHAGTNYIFCQQQGGEVAIGNTHNNWWAYTTSDQNTHGWVNAVYGRGGINDHGFDNVPNCNNIHGLAPLTPTTSPKSGSLGAPVKPVSTPVKPVAVTPVKPVTPAPAPAKPGATYSHNPVGTADSCALENGQTTIYGWATDTDAPTGSLPLVEVTINSGLSSQLTVGVPSNLVYRESTVNTYISSHYPGQSTPGTYGWAATIKGLYKTHVYKLSGTVINVGAGADTSLSINSTHGVDGTARPYFAAGIVPASCLASQPASGAIAKPVAGNGSTAVATPTPSPSTGNSKTVKPSKPAVAVKKITCSDLKHGKTCSDGKTTCDKGWKPDGSKHCTIDNAVVVRYDGHNDGCGGNATHYAANKTTHVSQENYGQGSLCKCNSLYRSVPYSKPISDQRVNEKCSAVASHRDSTSSSGSATEQASGSAKQCICGAPGCGSNCKDDGCGAHAQRKVAGNLKTPCVSIASTSKNICTKNDGFADGCHDPSNHSCGANGQWHYRTNNGCGCQGGWYGTYCQIRDYKPTKPVNKRVTCSYSAQLHGTYCTNGTVISCDTGYSGGVSSRSNCTKQFCQLGPKRLDPVLAYTQKVYNPPCFYGKNLIKDTSIGSISY